MDRGAFRNKRDDYDFLQSEGVGLTPGRPCGCGIYTVALIIQVTIVSYFAYGFYIEKENIDDKTLQLRHRLEDLLQSLKIQDNDDTLPIQANKAINEVITKAVNCDPDFALAKFIRKSNSSHTSHRHIEFPRPFLHLIGSEDLRTASNEGRVGNVDGMPLVTGWKVKGGNNCSKVDPKFDGSDINITTPGAYLVYSSVTFHTQSQDRVSIHRHMIEYTECFGNFCDVPKPLTENAYQIRSGKSKVSYQSGVYQFKKNEVLRVLVKKSPLTRFSDSNGDVEASFGVVAL